MKESRRPSPYPGRLVVEPAEHRVGGGWRRRTFHLSHPALSSDERTLEVEVPEALAPPQEAVWGAAVCTVLGPFADFLEASLDYRGTVESSFEANHPSWAKAFQCLHERPGVVGLQAERAQTVALPSGRKVASTFTGGIDSWFTLLRHNEDGLAPRVDRVLFIHGLDSDHRSAEVRAGVEGLLRRAAAPMGVEPVFLATNFRRDFRRAPWGYRLHGACIAGLAHLLCNEVSRLIFPSSSPLSTLEPWGSHPLTDGRLSNDLLVVEQDGFEFTRTEKTERVAESDFALEHLRVCYSGDGLRNCGKCEKCIRTKIQLALAGALDRCPSLGSLDARTVARMSLPEAWQLETYGNLQRECAETPGLQALARAIGHAVRWRWLNVGARRMLGRPV